MVNLNIKKDTLPTRTLPQIGQKGFTLVEILVVVAIIGVLAAISYPSYQRYIVNAKRADAMAELQQIASRIESQKLAYRTYSKVPLAKVYGTTPTSDGKAPFPYTGTALYDITVWDISNTNSPEQVNTAPLNLPGEKWQLRAIPRTNSVMYTDGTLKLDYEGKKCRGNDDDNCSTSTGEQWKN